MQIETNNYSIINSKIKLFLNNSTILVESWPIICMMRFVGWLDLTSLIRDLFCFEYKLDLIRRQFKLLKSPIRPSLVSFRFVGSTVSRYGRLSRVCWPQRRRSWCASSKSRSVPFRGHFYFTCLIFFKPVSMATDHHQDFFSKFITFKTWIECPGELAQW